jgi:hypothetical protein
MSKANKAKSIEPAPPMNIFDTVINHLHKAALDSGKNIHRLYDDFAMKLGNEVADFERKRIKGKLDARRKEREAIALTAQSIVVNEDKGWLPPDFKAEIKTSGQNDSEETKPDETKE